VNEEHLLLTGYERLSEDEMRERARDVLNTLKTRRTIRDFADTPVPRDIIESCIAAAGTAPSGANHQPWHFVAISNSDIKRKIRVAVFAQRRGGEKSGQDKKNYYVTESVGLATGLLITALHSVGLGTLTHTPAPMGFLRDICGRPKNEKPFVLMVVGYPSETATVPAHALIKKRLEEMSDFLV